MTGLRERVAGVFAPRERELFALLDAIATNAFGAVDRLEEFAHFFPDRGDLVDTIAEHAREADRLAAELNARLATTFVTAVERDDALALGGGLTDLVRSARAISALLQVYHVEHVRPEARRVTQLIASVAKALAAGIVLLGKAGDVEPHTGDVRALTHEGEDAVYAGLRQLFREDATAIELVRWRDLFDHLMGALDAGRRAATTLDAISAKQR